MTDNTSITPQSNALQSNSDADTGREAVPDTSRSSESLEPGELKSEASPEPADSDPEAPSTAKPQVISEDVSVGLEPQAEQDSSSRQSFASGDGNLSEAHDGSAKISSDASQTGEPSEAPPEQSRAIPVEDSRTGSTQSKRPTAPASSHWIKTAAVLVVGAALLGGLVLHRYGSSGTRRHELSSAPAASVPTDSAEDRPDLSQARPANEPEAAHEDMPDATPKPTPEAWMQASSQLIDTLLKKRHEIVELQRYYQSGIQEIGTDIAFESDEKGITTFDQALKNKRIELGLRTIQRRLAYIRELDQPCQWLEQGSEELQYLRRKTMIDRDMLPIAAGIDMDANLRHLNAAIDKYQPTVEKLAVHVQETDLQPLQVIWENIPRNDKETVHCEAVESHDPQVWQEICSGNLEHLAAVRELSADAAICISRVKAHTLFLNTLSRLSPSAARHLFEWKGEWICLNGFANLPPAVAKYLFQWKGKTISLNGLTEFSPELGKLLLTWQGRQIELMGLREQGEHPEDTGLSYLVQWEKSGGKVFVPDFIREKLQALR